MKVDVAYTCVTEGSGSLLYATRFVSTYHAYDPCYKNRLVPIFNGGPPPLVLTLPFESFPHQFFVRSNEGWDIGGYIEAAHGPCADCDIMACFGESVHFHRHGWLEKITQAWEEFGPGMYGFLSSNLVRPHLQTTAFATSPKLLREFPRKIVDKKDRYGFEHGRWSFMNWVELKGLPIRLVTFDGVYSRNLWRFPANINWKGNQENCLVWCNHTENYTKQTLKTKAFWENAVK